MIYSIYGKARLDSVDTPRSAGLFLAQMMGAIKQDNRNSNLPMFDQSLKYRHELVQVSDTGQYLDYWQAPFQTMDWQIGDCEDLSMSWCNCPPRLIKKATKFEPATYASGVRVVHAVVAAHGMPNIWQAKDDVKLYVASGDRYISKGEYDIGLIDPSFMCGMMHPYGWMIEGHCKDDPRYFVGGNRCTPENDISDRLNVTHRLTDRFPQNATAGRIWRIA